MQSFFQTLRAQATGSADFDRLRVELEQLVAESPDAIARAVTAIDAYFKGGILPEEEFLELRGMLKPHMEKAAAPQTAGQTRMRPEPGETVMRPAPSRTMMRPAASETLFRVESPAKAEVELPANATFLRERPVEPASAPPAPAMSGPAPPRAATDPEATGARRQARSESPQSLSKPRSTSGGKAADTDQRWEDPHTWTMADDEPLFEGRILGRRYQLERKLGEGGMGVVWMARDLIEADFNEQPFLAIKVLKPDFREHADALRALHEEVRRSKLLSHPNIVSVYTFDRDASSVFMTMEFLDGKTLSHVIEHEFARGMPISQAWPIIEGTGRALAYAHDRGTIHSDFKPSNVFVMAGGRAKVLDFGIARAMRHGRGTNFDAGTLGALTVEYASCEMLEDQPPDLRDDVYAYGCVVYELLGGSHVFGGKSATQARDQGLQVIPLKSLTRAQNKALASALAFDRAKRTGSIEEVMECLQPRPATRRFVLWMIAPLIALTVLGSVAWFVNKKFNVNEDDAFVNSLLKPNAEAATTVDPDEIALLMGQGDDYLTQAQKKFDPGILSEGVSTAYGAYRAVLRLDPANRAGAEKILAIVQLYEAQAESLREQGQYKRAATLVDYGLKIDPNRPSLRQMKTELDKLASQKPDG